VRYDPTRVDLDRVVAPPYDVLSEADRDRFAGRDPHNIVLVDVPLERHGPGRYDAAAATQRRWLDEGILIVDPEPSFYLERMTFTDEAGRERITVGVLGALEVVEPEAGDLLPHERTTPKARTDRLDLTRATAANLSPVWGLSMASGLSSLLTEPGTVLGEHTDDDGVHHVFERITDEVRLGALSAAVGAAPVVIADGHHRYEVARTYRAERRAATGGQPGPWDLTLAYVVELAEDQLAVQAIHRLLSGLPAGTDLEAVLARRFDFSPIEPVTPAITGRMLEVGALCLVHPDGRGQLLRPRPAGFLGVPDLDTARLDAALGEVPVTVDYQHGVEHVLEALTQGRATHGVLLRPVSVERIAENANAHALMPPKSTFFAPKPRTGLVLRSLESK
jgi:uncharacterized protein (DUF1015 family)